VAGDDINGEIYYMSMHPPWRSVSLLRRKFALKKPGENAKSHFSLANVGVLFSPSFI